MTTNQKPLSRKRSRLTGFNLCVSSLVLGGGFLWGVSQQSYWALAIPIGAGLGGVLASTFWVGYTLYTVGGPSRSDPADGESSPPAPWAPRLLGLALSLMSLGLAGAFGWGVTLQSYWAVAAPTAVFCLGLLAMAGRVGWAVFTKQTTLPLKADQDRLRHAPPPPQAS